MVEKDKKVAWVQEKVDELSPVLARAVKAIKDGKVELKWAGYMDAFILNRTSISQVAMWNSPDDLRMDGYHIAYTREWMPPASAGGKGTDWLHVIVNAPRRGRSPKYYIHTQIRNQNVISYHLYVTPFDGIKTYPLEIDFDAKGKAVHVVPQQREELLSVKCKPIPKSYIPKFPKPT